MCRYAAWIGQQRCLGSLVTAPENGLIAQSRRSCEALVNHHPDGSGLLWYAQPGAAPKRYINPMPAWRDTALAALANATQAPLFMAHVRAATVTPPCERDCHPFCCDGLSFMHNGELKDINRIAPVLQAHCPHTAPQGEATDSQWLFSLLLENGIHRSPEQAFATLVDVLREVTQALNVPFFLRLSAVFSDGHSLTVIRYATDDSPPSLYIARSAHGVAFASEPIGEDPWQPLPANSLTTASATQACTLSFNP